MLIKKNYQTTKKKKKAEKSKEKKEKNQINRKEMVATELILGMEELVNHIRDLEVKIQNFEKNETVREARVQELYEENKKLKEEKQKYQPKGSQIDPEGLHDYMKEENKKLREQVREYEYESNESGVKEKKLYEQLFSFQKQFKKLQEELLQQKKIAFWRMAEAYAGYDENTCIHDDDWCNEVKEAMEEYYGSGGEELGSIDELLEEYKNWIGYYEEPDSE